MIMQASAGARNYRRRMYLRHLILAAVGILSRDSECRCTRITARRPRCAKGDQAGFTSVMMDGSLNEDGKTADRLRIQRGR